ncbi:hypothetical protein JTE90_001862 [Oedothorax gibbosus]|uniref:Uncharacterized protein n=1 Tax=Oedothorax gibbosus TaxID=931172 RepID=A0AAV6VQ55_9ARAC|nr:hypothetical protein JTE90_001862 [Oedothorax gibbosus]
MSSKNQPLNHFDNARGTSTVNTPRKQFQEGVWAFQNPFLSGQRQQAIFLRPVAWTAGLNASKCARPLACVQAAVESGRGGRKWMCRPQTGYPHLKGTTRYSAPVLWNGVELLLYGGATTPD